MGCCVSFVADSLLSSDGVQAAADGSADGDRAQVAAGGRGIRASGSAAAARVVDRERRWNI